MPNYGEIFSSFRGKPVSAGVLVGLADIAFFRFVSSDATVRELATAHAPVQRGLKTLNDFFSSGISKSGGRQSEILRSLRVREREEAREKGLPLPPSIPTADSCELALFTIFAFRQKEDGCADAVFDWFAQFPYDSIVAATLQYHLKKNRPDEPYFPDDKVLVKSLEAVVRHCPLLSCRQSGGAE